MGGALRKQCRRQYKRSEDLKQRNRLLEDELAELKCKREKEISMHEHETKLFMSKEEKWRRERKKWREEVRRLKSRMRDEEEVVQMVDGRRKGDRECTAKVDDDAKWQLLSAAVLVEQMREEHALREEAVEKWKGLYHAIKTELDELILHTRHGGNQRLWLTSSKVEGMEGLEKERQAKDETMEALKARVAALEREATNRERQMDLMRQSLRILSNGRTGQTPRRSHSRGSYGRQRRSKK